MMYFIPTYKKTYKFPRNFGVIISPSKNHSGSAVGRIKAGWRWICDNGVFTGNFQEDVFFSFLRDMRKYQGENVFVVIPDVVGDSKNTLKQYPLYVDRVKKLGYKTAFAAQDGQEDLPFPNNFDALFVGGSTDWKLGKGAEKCIKRAQSLEKWVHVGRVNTRRRIHYFALLNVDSVDGTTIVYKPDKYRKDLIKWMDEAKQPLFYM